MISNSRISPRLCVDTTLLHFADELRGIHQVLFMILEILAEPAFRGRICFLSYPAIAQKYLAPLGILQEEITMVRPVPVLGRWDRFHAMFSTWRFRRATQNAIALIHPEPRGMTRLNIPQIVVWYDFLQIAKEWKPWKKPSRYLFTRYKYRIAMRRARGITISEFTRSEALRLFPKTDPARIKTLWLGTRKRLVPRQTPVAKPLALPLRCVYVGALETRKNVFNMLKNLDKIFGDIPFHLDLAGKISPEQRIKASEILSGSKYGSCVTLHGLVSDENLLNLMEHSNVTLFPSHDEGFGLPVAEAMMHGHAVFAFKNSSIPEVGGEAIVLSENDDFTGWGRELEHLLNNPSACIALRHRALERSDLFSEESMKNRYREYFLNLLTLQQT